MDAWDTSLNAGLNYPAPPPTHIRFACEDSAPSTHLTLRLKYLSLLTVKLGSLHSGHDFPSLWSLDTTSADRWCPQHSVCLGSRSNSKVTGQKYSWGGSSTESYSCWGMSGACTSVRTVGEAGGPPSPRFSAQQDWDMWELESDLEAMFTLISCPRGTGNFVARKYRRGGEIS